MVIIFTDDQKFNEMLASKIENSRIAYYTDYLLDEKEADIVIMTVQNNKFEFEKYLFQLRKRNIRVILLLDEKETKEKEIAIRMGIYDLFIKNVKVEELLDAVKVKNNFSKIADIYKETYNIEEELKK